MSQIRNCTADDIPAIARIFQKTFRDARKSAPASLHESLREVLFGHPGADPDLPSRVYVAPDGTVAGFMGVLPLRMSFRGREVRAAVPTSLAVDDPKKHPLAGAKLVRAFLAGPQDISISEPAEKVSQGLWRRIGGETVPSESMEWMRVFHPAGLALAMLGDSWPARIVRPGARLIDRLADRLARGYFSADTSPRSFHHDADVADDLLLQHIPEFAASYQLHPVWDDATMKWMLNHASQNRARGPLFRRMVYRDIHTPVGCYLYQGRPNKVAWVMQVLACADALEPVLDSMFAHAYRNGNVAIKGRTQLRLLDPLMRRNCVFFRRHSAMVHSRNPELLVAVRSGGAITSGFAAEAWLRLSGDRFE